MNAAAGLNLVGGCLLGLLGVAVLIARGRESHAAAFGAFAIAFGAFILEDAWTASLGFPPIWVSIILSLTFAVTAASLTCVFPFGVRREETRPLLLALGVGVAAVLARHLALVAQQPEYLTNRLPGEPPAGVFALQAAGMVANVVGAFAMTFLPLRMRRLSAADHAAARSLAFFSVGVGLFHAGNAFFLVAAAHGAVGWWGAVSAALVFLPALVAWLLATRGPHRALARNVLLVLATLFTLATLSATVDAELVYPAGRVLGALLLGYAVMRGQLEGLDLKLRFAISKSTVAAVFIAVFFVASEAAQQFFGDTTQSAYLGIAAAGALVFALAPLQRAAERLAERAVPIAAATRASTPLPSDARGEASYRKAVRLAMRDRRITREEEGHLHELARDLGIDGARAHAIIVEVEAERAGGAAP